MGQDDDEDCVEHQWQLTDVVMHRGQLDQASTCAKCAAVKYDPSPQALGDSRPPL